MASKIDATLRAGQWIAWKSFIQPFHGAVKSVSFAGVS
jgi:hypothetical protein